MPATEFTFAKNFNLYWVWASSLAIWFLFVHAPPILLSRQVFLDAPFLWHLIGSYSIYLACICNTIITPSVKRLVHIWVGRFGMVMGSMGFFLGLYLCWWPWRTPLPPLGFSIGITIGGVAQIMLQIRGYIAIRKFQAIREKLDDQDNTRNGAAESAPLVIDREQLERDKTKYLKIHIQSMLSLFVIACGIPAAMRIVEKFGGGGFPVIMGLVLLFQFVAERYSRVFTSRLPP